MKTITAFICLSLLAMTSVYCADEPEIKTSRIQIVDVNEQPWYEAADRAIAREIASPRNSKAERMSIAEIVIPAGVAVIPHHHLMEEVYHIVEGEGTMMVEDETAIIRKGQSVIIAPHEWHSITNHTDKELRLIVTCAPAWAPEHLKFERLVESDN
ncbi:MAG: cupin domain-containing protein [Verrucomicrobiota bacterium]